MRAFPDSGHGFKSERHPTDRGRVTEPTRATEAIDAAGIPHRVVRTQRAQSAEESAELQGIELGALLRTIVVRRGDDDYVFVLVPGGRRFDWPKVRAHLGVKRLSLPDADEAREVTGYERGAITPFGATPRLAGHRRRIGDGSRRSSPSVAVRTA